MGEPAADAPLEHRGSGTTYAERLRALLSDVAEGRVSADQATERLRDLPFADLGYARVDHHRELRQGQCEIVYAAGKTAHEVAGIVRQLLRGNEGPILVSRAEPDQRSAVRAVAEEAGVDLWERPRPGAIALTTIAAELQKGKKLCRYRQLTGDFVRARCCRCCEILHSTAR